ncbi:MAG TPA: DNA replication and repair protein RecF, partial [Sphingobacteriaceae bacterium]|nr:DNA replication and repair protein RecF [Sphingobacteriaceae bacterium]
MIIKRISLTNYRNIETATIDLHPRLTIFLGPNGVGKTNILESIHLLSFPRSFRTRKDELLKQWDKDFCRVEGSIDIDEAEHSLVFFHDKSKKLQMDGQTLNASMFVGQFLSVLFAPEDVDLLSSSPTRRRGFLDAHLALLSPQYFSHLLHYNKVIKQRNKLLSKPNISSIELDFWNTQQIEHGTALIESRVKGIDAFNRVLFPELNI